jgi:hypothetical protein
MPLDTNLNVSPFFDDYDETKNYHRVLIKPTTAVQARELNQIQSILQNQIERFGNSIYKDGAVINGCNISFYPQLNYVRLMDNTTARYDANNQVIGTDELIDVNDYLGKVVKSVDTGLMGRILTTKSGTEQDFPYTNRFYIQYMNSGTRNGAQVQSFADGDVLDIFENPYTVGRKLATTVAYNNAISTGLASGVGYGISTGEGLIYQKGFFIRSEPQTLVISDTVNPGNTVIGFATNEFIVDANQDGTLVDNALGYQNENAPGADRLKLVANLTFINADDLSSTADFTSIVQYVSGVPVIENPDQKYSQIGDEMNRRSSETNGSFVIKPFNVDTGYGSANYLVAKVSAGSGYSQGSRVELLKTTPVGIRRGTDTRTADSQLITTNYGNYVIVNEYAGVFDFTKLEEVAIFDTPQQAVSKKSFTNSAFTGNQIGTANIRAVQYLTGLEGTPAAQHEVYLFNIRMNPGKSFSTNAKALVFNANGNKGFADLVSSDIQNGERRTMIWGFGNRAIKNLKDDRNNINTQYVFRQKSTSTLNSNGTISLTLTTAHAGGANKFPYGTGITLGDGLENDFVVVALQATETAVIGNVSVVAASTTITGAPSGKPFSSMFSVGDYVRVASDIRRVIGVDANNLVVDSGFSATNSTAPYTRYIQAGYTFPFNDSMVGNRTIQINSETQATLSVGTSVAGVLISTIPVAVYHNVLRSNMVPIKKNILKNYVVKIDTATHAAGANGPWPLGWTDVHDLKNVFVTSGNTFITSGNDLLSLFNFDTGQADTHYGIGFLYLKPGASLPAGSKLTVVADVFQTDTTQGVGFYSVDSYPIDDNNTANTTAITTANLPVYVSSTGRAYALRDSIDCRPSKALTANYAPFPRIDLASTNPPDTNAFQTDTVGTYVPAPDQNFETDLTYYVGRKDMIYFSNRGFVKVKEGVANEYPQTPAQPDDGMAICVVQIPPYPSLSSAENADVSAKNKLVYNKIRDTSYGVSVSIVTNKRYRMQDIGTIDQRVSRLEYYQALNLLEQATTSLQVPDAQGLDRFKNGIFVDPFTNFSLGDVGNPEFKIAIDSAKGVARPFYNEERPELEFATSVSSGVVKTGRLITLPYTSVPYTGQPYATNLRNAASVQYLWTGSMTLFPAYGHNIDKVAAAAVQVSLDMASPWQDFANSPFGMNWGDWRVTNTDTSSQSNITGQQAINGVLATTTDTTTTTTTSNARSGQKLNIDVTNSSYNLGNYVQDISIQPYIATSEIAFYAWGVRPNTRLYATFDGVVVTDSVAPGVRNPSVNDTTSSDYVTRTAPYGSPLVSDANGTVYGKFLIPAAKFRVGERILRITDVARVNIGENSLTTSASASYTSSNFTVTSGSTTLSTVNPELSTTGLSDAYSTTTASTTTNLTVSPDPNYVAPIPVVNNITNVTNDITNNTYLTEVTNVTNVTEVTNVTNTAVTNVYNTEVVQPTPVENPVLPVYVPPDPPVVPPPPVVDVFNPTVPPGGLTVQFADDFIRGMQSNGMIDPHFTWVDPLAQAIRVEITGGIAGMFLTYIDIYFQKKSTTQSTGCSVYMTEILNGYPDNTRTMPFSRAHLNWEQIATSEDGQTATRFYFDSPVYATNGKQYAFVIFPDGGDPDYVCWTAILGNNDVKSGVQVSSKPYVDTAFYSSNQQAWSALQNEFVKFNIGRASFTSLNGTAGFNAEAIDYLTLTNITPVSSARTMSVGDRIYGVQGGVLNTGIAGKVAAYDVVKGKVTVSGTTGYFNNSPTVEIHRLANDTDAPSSGSLVATATISKVGNLPMNVIVPRFATISPSGTSLKPAFRGVSGNYSPDGASTSCNLDMETEMYDYERIVPSRSNEVTFANGAKLFNVTVDFHSDSTYVSPVIDLVRSNILAIYNLIDPTNFDVSQEYGNNGAVQTKYVSKVVTLANGQDAEDLKVWLTAYKPLSSKILVYGKFLSGEDPDTIIQKTWTPLDIDDDTVFSDFRNVEDYREIVFTVPKSVIGPATNAFVDPINGLSYTSTTSAKYSSYKAFQLKIVLLSDTTARVPRLNDVRAVALQL